MQLPVLESMLHNKLSNYIVPGLHSSLVGGQGGSKVRLFHAERDTRDVITPHSHRFSFSCIVLEGKVENTIYVPSHEGHSEAEPWIRSTVTQVCGANGVQDFVHEREDKPSFYRRVTTCYGTGQVYSMDSAQIHSITFKKGTKVLFFEGPTIQSTDNMIEPFVNGKLVPTFKIKWWMFHKDWRAP